MNKKFPKYFLKRFNRKAVLFIFFAFFAFSILLFPNNKKAQAWDAMAANGMLFTMEKVQTSIINTITSAIKIEAVTFMNEEIDNTIAMVAGGSGSVLGVTGGIIDDWQTFLIQEPANQVASYLEEFLFNATGGRSSSNYRTKVGRKTASTFNSEGFGETVRYGLIRTASAQTSSYSNQKSYNQKIRELNESIREEKRRQWSLESEEPTYEENIDEMFSKKNLKPYISFISDKNFWAYRSQQERIAEQQYQNKKNELYLRALIARGIYNDDLRVAVSEDDVKKYTDTAPMQMVINASNPVEAAAAMTLVSINKVLKKAIKNVRKSYQQDLAAYRKQITTSVTANFTGARPQDVFKQQLQDRQARQNKFGTGANYENINVDAEIKKNEALKNRTLTSGQLQKN